MFPLHLAYTNIMRIDVGTPAIITPCAIAIKHS